jgi:3-oxoacyl-[acyl-carrier-protein] synthase III
MFSGWKEERVPEYALVVSTNTPSQQIAYDRDVDAAWLYGDSAAACVLSRKHPGKYPVLHAASRVVERASPAIVVERYVSHRPADLISSDHLTTVVRAELDLLASRFTDIFATGIFIFPQLFSAQCEGLASSRGISAERIVSGVKDTGYSFGSSSGVALSSVWDSVVPGQKVAIIHCGDGVCGSSVLVSS